jgi:membrane dipeptidase
MYVIINNIIYISRNIYILMSKMVKVKKYGYKSWDFLERDAFKPYAIEPQINRVPEYDFGLDKTQTERFERIVEKNINMSFHEHLAVFPEEGPRERHRLYKGYEGLAHSGMDFVFDGGARYIGPTGDNTVNYLGMGICDYSHSDLVIPVMTYDDILRAKKEGKVGVAMSTENITDIGQNIDKVDLYWGLGLRLSGLVSYLSNSIGSDLSDTVDGGLKNFGYDVVRRMNKLGMIIDLSHAHDLTAMEAVEASNKPIIITHCGSRTLFNNMRMKPDNVLQAMAEKGGAIGIESAGFGLRSEKYPDASVEGTLEHVEYLMELLGADHVGVGYDSFWGDHAGMYLKRCDDPWKPHKDRPRPKNIPPAFDMCSMRATTPPDFPHVVGAESPSDVLNIAKGLIRDGYSDNEIMKVMGQNGMRIIKANWPK